jgi:hypothetical protein
LAQLIFVSFAVQKTCLVSQGGFLFLALYLKVGFILYVIDATTFYAFYVHSLSLGVKSLSALYLKVDFDRASLYLKVDFGNSPCISRLIIPCISRLIFALALYLKVDFEWAALYLKVDFFLKPSTLSPFALYLKVDFFNSRSYTRFFLMMIIVIKSIKSFIQ